MLTRVEYTHVAIIEYVRSVHLGVLDIAPSTANYKATRLQEEHKELIELNCEANNVETTPLK